MAIITLSGAYLYASCTIETTHFESQSQYEIDPLQVRGSFVESSVFRELYRQDIDNLIYYLAVLDQMETKGKLDLKKEIDIVGFYYRRYEGYNNVSTNQELVYTLSDLVDMGTGYTTFDGYLLDEIIFPKSKQSVYGKNLVNIFKTCGLGDDLSKIIRFNGWEDEFSQEQYSEEESLTNSSKPLSLEEQQANFLLYKFLTSASQDIRYNYDFYQQYNEHFQVPSNFVYYYDAGEEDSVKDRTNIQKNSLKKEEVISKFSELQTSAVCDIKNLEVTSQGVNNQITVGPYETNKSFDSMYVYDTIKYYQYALNNKGSIYYGYVDDKHKGFFEHQSDDTYATVEKAFQTIKVLFEQWFVIDIVLAIILLITFIVSCICTRKIEITEDKPAKGLDWLWTEFVWGLSLVVLALATFGAEVVFEMMRRFFGYQTFYKNFFFQIAVVAYVVFVYIVCLTVFLDFVRRVKSRRLIRHSFTYFFFKNALKLINHLFNHMNTALIVWIPFLLFLMINLFFVAVFGVIGTFLIFLFDMCVGIFLYYKALKQKQVLEGIERISSGEVDYKVDTAGMFGGELKLANSVNQIGSGIQTAVETSLKDEKLKTELITNVSHDIKTPLTSIINYVDLIKRENYEDETLKQYIDVLDMKSQRLKQLTEDLVEASKISSGNISIALEELDVITLINQVIGEFDEALKKNQLDVITNFPEPPVLIMADSRHIVRVFDNLFANICKYSMPNTRVYVRVTKEEKTVVVELKNISKEGLNITPEELTERFIRGDKSRNTEGSGLGLSIAKSLVVSQDGEFTIQLDGDLFKVMIVFSR